MAKQTSQHSSKRAGKADRREPVQEGRFAENSSGTTAGAPVPGRKVR